MYTYEERFDMIVVQAGEIITNNWLGVYPEAQEDYIKAIRDAVQNSWYEGITNDEWLDNVLERFNAK